jgi:hypothetical protein
MLHLVHVRSWVVVVFSDSLVPHSHPACRILWLSFDRTAVSVSLVFFYLN